MKRKLMLFAAAALAVGLSGCAFDFTGKRDITGKLVILGNSFEWTSTVDGAYTRTGTNAAPVQPAPETTIKTVTTVSTAK